MVPVLKLSNFIRLDFVCSKIVVLIVLTSKNHILADDDAICLSRAAKIVRRDILDMEAKFTGSFDQDCQKNLYLIHYWH